ncbi:MAG: YD repeat-containing protein [Rhodobacteraceae bacterium HLUCCA24]|nr:MAG: YD repeat-containing protein [Rhodobacteraceae bacterium HLUCCA24]
MQQPVFTAEKRNWDQTKPMCHVVKAGDFLWLSGIVAYDEQGNVVGHDDIAAQARQIFTIMQRRLAMFGCDLTSVIRLTNYLTTPMTDMKFTRQYWAARQEFFGEHRPASTGVQVAALMLPELLVEVDAVAYAPNAVPGDDAVVIDGAGPSPAAGRR